MSVQMESNTKLDSAQTLETSTPISTNIDPPSESSTTTTTTTTATNSNSPKLTIKDYLDYFVHSIECKEETSCSQYKCKNFKRLFAHFKQCKKHFECESCRWLLNLIIIHSKSCDKLPACNIPLCQTIKARLSEKELFLNKMLSIKEFLTNNLALLDSKNTKSTQTSNESNSKKRKLNEEDLADSRNLDETDQKYSLLVSRLNLLKDDLLVSTLENRDNSPHLFEKSIRTSIVKYLVDANLNVLQKSEPHFDRNKLIPLAFHVIKTERTVYRKTKSTDDYLDLMSDFLHTIRGELCKKVDKIKSRISFETQVSEEDLECADLTLETDSGSLNKKFKST